MIGKLGQDPCHSNRPDNLCEKNYFESYWKILSNNMKEVYFCKLYYCTAVRILRPPQSYLFDTHSVEIKF